VASQIEVRCVRIHTGAHLPRYGRRGDAGLDVCATESRTLPPGGRYLFATGIAVEIPDGYVGLVWDRSSMGVRGLTTFGGVIDSSYRGEIKVLLYNASDIPQVVDVGDRIAQLLIQHIEEVTIVEAEALSGSDRGTRGFGSTGSGD